MNRKIIGIAGLANSGKDTTADYIVSKYSNFKKIALSEPIKNMMINLFGFTYEQCYKQELKKTKDDFWDITPRDAMILIGTKLFRDNWREDFWIKLAEKRIISEPNKNFVVSDIRFDNEAEMIKKLGGKVIVIYRPDNQIKINHKSENGICYKLVDDTIINDCNLNELYNKIDLTLKKI